MPESTEPEAGTGSKPSSHFESCGDRFRFTVELRPGETTIVSWKKLLREANITNDSSNYGSSGADPVEAQNQQQEVPPQLPSSKTQLTDGSAQDVAATNRLSSVIERIEHMYAGNGSSDEEDVVLDDVPDDDEYDTEDSFIDDTELDDYFQVDKSKLKHDGFFINRGKLERIEFPTSTSQQAKKRRRKVVMKENGGNGDANNPPKVKNGNISRKSSSSIERNLTNHLHLTPVSTVDVPHGSSAMNVSEISMKKEKVEAKATVYPSATSSRDQARHKKDADKQIIPLLKNNSSKVKEGGELQDTSTQKSIEKTSTLSKSDQGTKSNNIDEKNLRIQRKDKGALVGRFDLNVPPATASRNSLETLKGSPVPRKYGSSMKQRSAMLEKAIRELEMIVSKSRPPSTEVHIPDSSSQAVKRRLPPEIKQKLAKVSRLSYAGFGKIPKDVLNRLMSIVGHLMQLQTLKRNIKIMANMGLSAKREKDDKLQKTKQEIAEMVSHRVTNMKSKIEKQQTTNSDDFQEIGPHEKKATIKKHMMDDTLENKICDLYDLYVEKLEEDSGPPVKRLYEELAALWPSDLMDSYGIKHAIFRAKKRKTLQPNQQKNPENVKKKKKLTTPKASRGEAASASQTSHFRDKETSDSHNQFSNQGTKQVLSATLCPPDIKGPLSLQTVPYTDKTMQKKMKANSSGSAVDAGSSAKLLQKNKVKKPSIELGDRSQFRLENTSSEERLKLHHKDLNA